MIYTKAKQKEFIDSCREQQLKDYDKRLTEHNLLAIINVPVLFKGHTVKPLIRGNENGQGWILLMYYWDVEYNLPFAKLGIYKEVVQ